MAEVETKNIINTIPIKNLMQTTSVNDADIMVIEDDTTTYKIKASDLVCFIRETVKDTFVQLVEKGHENGVAPLNSNAKIDSNYLSFGKSAGTIYDGNDGTLLESSIGNHKADTSNPHKTTASQLGLSKVENKNSETIRSEITAQNVIKALGFTPEIDGSYENAVAYVDQKIAELINDAPETLDTLKEIADALADNKEVIDTINNLITTKASQSELDTHVGNGIIHVTAQDKANINTSLSHSNSAHARTDATSVAASATNGNIRINDTESTVYEHPLSGVNAGTYRQVTVDTKGHVTGGNNPVLPITQGGTGATTAAEAFSNLGITATIAEVNKLDGVNTTTAELNYLHGVTSSIQTQLNNTAKKNHGEHLPTTDSSSDGSFLMANDSSSEWHKLSAEDISTALGYVPGTGSNVVTAVKGDAETEYQTGNVNITPAKIGLKYVDNTPDKAKSVASAAKLSTTRNINGINFNGEQDIVHYGVCSSSATDTTKIVPCANFSLVTGAHIRVKFTVTNSASAPVSLNVNNTGDKTIKYHGGTIGGSWLSANRVLEFVYDGTDWLITGDLDNNNRTSQTNTTTSGDYRVLMSYNTNDTSESTYTRKSNKFLANPATGEFFATGYRRNNLTNTTIDINTLNLSSGSPSIAYYICKTIVGSSNISNIPVAGQPFVLDVELMRWGSTTDYITMQTFRSISQKTYEYVRYCTNGTWTSWTTRVFTDTKNTSGSTNTSNKIFLIGATSQASNPQTYSHDTVYVGTDGCLYSNGKRITTELISATEPTGLQIGDYWLEKQV